MRRFLVVLACVGVLLFNALIVPGVALGYYTGMPASVVIGQPDFNSGSSNQGGSPTANTLSNVIVGIDSDGTRLFVSDGSNNRVLIYNHLPTTNNAPADVVLGQVDFTHNTANQGGTASASTMSAPRGLVVNNGKLFVVDSSNNRVLIWNTLPTNNDQPADVVVGQPDFQTVSIGTTASKLSSPFNLFVYQGKLFIADPGGRRVVIFNSIPNTNGASADVVVGQTNMTTGSYGGLDASHFASSSSPNSPRDVVVYQGKMLAFDFGNARIMIWNSVPTANGTAADVVVGQPNFTTVNVTGGDCSTYISAGGLTVTPSGRMLVSDQRILIYNQIPGANGASADLVIGQPDCTTRSFSPITSSSVSNAVRFGIEINNKMYVADSGNARVLIYPNTITTPQINLTSSPISIGSGRYRLTGNVIVNKNADSYALQTLQADLNGVGYNNITFPGGRDDGAGNTIFDFTYDFDPTVGNGSINNLTIKFLASTWNADTNTLFYFLPFKFNSFNVSSTKSQSFTFSVNKDQLQRIKDNLDHFEVWYKPNTTTGKWTQYISNIPDTQIDQNGLVIATKTTNNIKFIGSYIFKIQAIDNWGNRQDSNYLYTSGYNPITLLTSYPSFGKSFVPVPSPIGTTLPTIIPATSPTYTPYVIPTEMPLATPSQETKGPNSNIILFSGLIAALVALILFILWKRRKKE